MIHRSSSNGAALQVAQVVANQSLCREHLRLTFRLPSFPGAAPGQFVHVSPAQAGSSECSRVDGAGAHDSWRSQCAAPMLRRAFSIAGMRRDPDGVYVDIIYRVVGIATRWLASLRDGDFLSVLGPLGNRFEIHESKTRAWLIAGGVGLPPMLWLAQALQQAGKSTVAFCGAQSRDLLALTIDDEAPPDPSAANATLSALEFSRCGAKVILSTDDGSLGFGGHIGAALEAYFKANPVPVDDLVFYTCGPERMMRFVAEFASSQGVECHACMERAMACGTGLCQSCVVPVHDDADAQGWRYRLCCTDGPVFDARTIIWEPAEAT